MIVVERPYAMGVWFPDFQVALYLPSQDDNESWQSVLAGVGVAVCASGDIIPTGDIIPCPV